MKVRIVFLVIFQSLTLRVFPYPLISDVVNVYGSYETESTVNIFDREKIPEVALIGNELVAYAWLRAGALLNLFPITFDIGTVFSQKDTEFKLTSCNISWFSDNWSVQIGKQRTIWGLGTFYMPLFILDFISSETASQNRRNFPNIWALTVCWYSGVSGITLRGAIDERWIESANNPDWLSGQVIYGLNMGRATTNIQIAYLYRDASGDASFGLEAKLALADNIYFTTSGIVSHLNDATGWKYRFESSFELGILDNQCFTIPEIYFDSTQWYGAITILLQPLKLNVGLSDSLVYAFLDNAWRNVLEIKTGVGDEARFALVMTSYWGDGKTSLGDEVLPLSLQLNVGIYLR